MSNIIEVNPDKRNTVILVYILYALGFLVGGITAVIGFIIALVNKDSSSALERSHFKYQINLFMWGLLWFIVGTITTYILIGFAILLVWVIWTIYKLIVGWQALSNNQLVK